MPQLDFASFLPQFFWLLPTFLGLYLVLAKIYLPRIARIKKVRERKLSDTYVSTEIGSKDTQAIANKYLPAIAKYCESTKAEASHLFTQKKAVYAHTYTNGFMQVVRGHKQMTHLLLPLVARSHRFAQLSKVYFLTRALKTIDLRKTKVGVQAQQSFAQTFGFDQSFASAQSSAQNSGQSSGQTSGKQKQSTKAKGSTRTKHNTKAKRQTNT
jgi:hypothetical protein